MSPPTNTYHFVEPTDVLMIRGNKAFGGDGQHGDAVMPPWPSTFAGAFRSALLGKDASRLASFAHDGQRLPGELGAVLGTRDEPGSFAISWLSLAVLDEPASIGDDPLARTGLPEAKSGVPLAIVPLPADLVAFDDPRVKPLIALQPARLPAVTLAGGELPLVARLHIATPVKPQSGRWLDGAGLAAHLRGELPARTLPTGDLFKRETRLGIALNHGSRTAVEGALYTSEAITLCGQTGFLAGCEGDSGQLARHGRLRLGGDGKGARYRAVAFTPPGAPLDQIDTSRRFRIILATPGIFAGGWLPEGVSRDASGDYRLQGEGFSARLSCAAVPRFDTISGWDLARQQPKTAQRVAPAGSVYWFDKLAGDAGKLAEWVARGLWGDNPDRQRRAEGFNRAWLGAWRDSP
ncbi:type III-B CRISPR module-associated Cmr3 family protein [Candidatus Accumulibacter sp. ACC003]|uniref:type III-B CRISPR module-associated Cmr3 family protein n=1 Tax=Candidatus Accumulibacter sp. ACC003 TaxID=2823334 RepID=UPI0025BBBF30|nr:type III-B CRISPR module-associated Cmr3 family protein [Candidatus Accumulibacter sp. ACC003]